MKIKDTIYKKDRIFTVEELPESFISEGREILNELTELEINIGYTGNSSVGKAILLDNLVLILLKKSPKMKKLLEKTIPHLPYELRLEVVNFLKSEDY